MEIKAEGQKNSIKISNNQIHTTGVSTGKQNNAINVTNNASEYWSNRSKEYAEDAEQSALEAKGIVSNFDKHAEDKKIEFNINAQNTTTTFNNNANETLKEIKGEVSNAKSWAVGTINERPEGSAKYYAEKAKAESANKLEAKNIIQGDNITLEKTGKNIIINATGGVSYEIIEDTIVDIPTVSPINGTTYEVID